MSITRRSLLQGSAGTLFAASPTLEYTPPRISQRGLITQGTKKINALPSIPEAIYTNDNGWFTNNATIANMPLSAEYILVSYAWRTQAPPPFGIGSVLSIGYDSPSSGYRYNLEVSHIQSPFPNGPQHLSIACNSNVEGAAGANWISWLPTTGNWADTTPFGYNIWNHNLIYISTRDLYIDALMNGTNIVNAQSYAYNDLGSAASPFSLALSGSSINHISVGGAFLDPRGRQMSYSALAEVVFAALTSPIDIRDPNVFAAFYDISKGFIVRQPTNGSIAIIDLTTGNVIRTIQAQIVLSGAPGEFERNFPGWTFEAGAAAQDSTPSSQFQIQGNVTIPPFTDPWGT